MIDLLLPHKPGHPSKAIDWEHLIRVIVFQDLADLHNGTLILVELVQVVEGARVSDFSIRSCEVNGTDQTHSPARPQIVHEGW